MPNVQFSTEINNRYQFGELCARKGLLGTAMELGVFRGEFAGHFLGGWPGKRYVAVDRYLPTDDCNSRDGWSKADRQLDRELAHAKLARFERRGVLEWKELDTIEAIEAEPVESLDFVYIDAGHRYWEVRQECFAAWERVKPGGIVAGHDYAWDLPTVVRAVNEFADQVGQPVWLTCDAHTQWSWYVEKPIPAAPEFDPYAAKPKSVDEIVEWIQSIPEEYRDL